MISRRELALGAGALLLGGAVSGPHRAHAEPGTLAERLATIEAEVGGRLGVAMLDAATGAVAGHRLDERFALCSTFKALAAAAVLARVDAGSDSIDRRVHYTAAELVTYSPTTKNHAGEAGMTLAELCEAAVTLSDNTAGNLLLAAIGGPAGLTAYLRGLGDKVTRLDRIEPFLNEAAPGDRRDTTSPAAMATTLRNLVVGDALSPASRARLTDWLIGCKTGDDRLRAGVPAGWRIGDKTGSGGNGATNDVAVLWPPGRAPIVVAAYLAESVAPPGRRNAVLAAVGRAVVQTIAV
jgi:beta-lactamase class A